MNTVVGSEVVSVCWVFVAVLPPLVFFNHGLA
jgi:hypothetical protein